MKQRVTAGTPQLLGNQSIGNEKKRKNRSPWIQWFHGSWFCPNIQYKFEYVCEWWV